MIMTTKKCIELHSEYLNELFVLFTFFFGFFLFLLLVFVLSYITINYYSKYTKCECIRKIKDLSEKQEKIVSTLFLSNSMVVRNIANERISDNCKIMNALDNINQQLSE